MPPAHRIVQMRRPIAAILRQAVGESAFAPVYGGESPRNQDKLFMPRTVPVQQIGRCARSVRGLGNSRLLKWLGQEIPEMEPTMISLKVLGRTVAITVLVARALLPTAGFAQAQVPARGGGGAPAAGGGGRGAAIGGGGGFRGGTAIGGGGFRASGAIGGGGMRGAAVGAPAAVVGGGVRGAGAGPVYSGGGYRGGWGRGYHRGGGGFIPGAVAGAVVGGALASSYGYYGYGDPYYAQGYYDDSYVDDGGVVAVDPGGGGDDSYCRARFRSYDPASGTYLGNDGLRHPCP